MEINNFIKTFKKWLKFKLSTVEFWRNVTNCCARRQGRSSFKPNSYPNINLKLWYADHDCYGPYEINSIKNVPKPKGGGGTDFEPFFEDIKKQENNNIDSVSIYLTDGYGYFPEYEPEIPVLWVVIPGGAENNYFPFGEITRLNN